MLLFKKKFLGVFRMCVPVYICMCSIVSVHAEDEGQYKLALLLTPYICFYTVYVTEPKRQVILARLDSQ